MTPEIEQEIERRIALYRTSLEAKAKKGELHAHRSPRRDEAKALFDAGFDRKQIAAKMGISVVMAGVHLLSAGCVEKRKPNPSPKDAEKRNKVILKEFDAGVTRKELAQRYEITAGRVSEIVKTERRREERAKWRSGIIQGHMDGVSNEELARRFDTSKYWVATIIERALGLA